MDHQDKTCYVAVPVGDAEDEMKPSMNNHSILRVRAMGFLKLFLILSLVSFVAQKILFNHHTSNFYHFEKHGRPCHHHVNFDPNPSDEHHHDMHSHSMGKPPKMPHPPHHGGFFHHHDEHHHHKHPHNMGPPEMNHPDHYHGAASHDGIMIPLPPPIDLEPNTKWLVHDSKESFDDTDRPSGDGSESGDEINDLDMWERIADYWDGSKKDVPSSDSSESGDESNDLDMWERIANYWDGSNDDSKDSEDSSDDSGDEDVWERIAVVWKSFSSEYQQRNDVASSDKN